MWYTIIKSRLHMKRSVLVGSKQKICTVDDRSGEIAGSCRRGTVAAVPFLMYGTVTPVQALFESVSGFTTTGLSVLDVEKLPHIFLFYRAFLQYVGGLGFIMTMLLFVQEKDSYLLSQGNRKRIADR